MFTSFESEIFKLILDFLNTSASTISNLLSLNKNSTWILTYQDSGPYMEFYWTTLIDIGCWFIFRQAFDFSLHTPEIEYLVSGIS